MKILVVTQYFRPENFRVNDLVDGLVERGHEVTVLTGQPNYPEGSFSEGYGWLGPRREIIGGASVIRVPLVARGSGRAYKLVLNYLSFALFASLAAIFRLSGQFDIIFVFAPSPITVAVPAVVAKRRFGAPVVLWVLDLWPESLSATGAIRSRRMLNVVAYFVRHFYRWCDRILVQSKGFVENVMALGVSPSRIDYFPNWIERDYEGGGGAPSRQIAPSKTEFRIVYAGNIGAAQDFPAIVQAAELVAKKCPSIRWVVAGDGRMAGWVREEIDRRGLSTYFDFLGQLPPESMPALFASADALLVALRQDPVFALTIPGKVQSYLASGTPVLAMLDGEGANLIMESGGGFACPAGDSAALAELVVRFSELSVEDRAEMGQRASAYAYREFGRNRLFDRLDGWFSETVENMSRKT